MVRFWIYTEIELTEFADGLDVGCERRESRKILRLLVD